MALRSIIPISRGILFHGLPRKDFPIFHHQSVFLVANSRLLSSESFLAHHRHNDVGSTSSSLIDCQHKHLKINFMSKRFKKSKRRAQKSDDDEDNTEEDDEDDIAEENPLLMDDLVDKPSDGSQRVVLDVGSLRLDAVGKMGFSVTRLKMEELFYKGDVYINGERASKKGQDLHVGDEIDLIKQINPEDRSKVDIKRIVIISIPDKATETGRMKITIDRWMDLTVDAPDRKD